MVRTYLGDRLGVRFMLIGVKWHGVLYLIHCAQVSATTSQRIFFFLHISHACTMSVRGIFDTSSSLQTLMMRATDGSSFLGPSSIACGSLSQFKAAASDSFELRKRCLDVGIE